MIEKSLILIKPHILKNPIAFNHINRIIENEFQIIKNKKIYMTEELTRKFYEEHQNKFYYNRLLSQMTSGPAIAIIIAEQNCISKWRKLMGPTKVYKSVFDHPDCIRSLYGLSDTRNACHGSDSQLSALKEISIIFPNYAFDD